MVVRGRTAGCAGDFGILPNEASLPYTMEMIGFAFGGVLMGRLADRYGIVFPAFIGTLLLGLGYLGAGYSPNIWVLATAHTVIGIGTSATFIRADRLGYVAPVQETPWRRDRHRVVRELSFGRRVAAGRAVFHRDERLAHDHISASRRSASSR